MSVLKLIVAYDGTNYHGFARQIALPTIQEELENAIYKLTGQKVEVIGAGRTDAGVHAKGQCCICRLETNIPIKRIATAINSQLPKDIAIQSAEWAPDTFHPRFDAKGKTYRYQINHSRTPDPFNYRYSYDYSYNVSIERMKEAAKHIIGTHDFSCFCAAGSSVKTTVRTIYRIDITEVDHIIQIDICGNGFLYNMVRIIVGTLLKVGRGKIEPSQIPAIIESKKRESAGPTAPPEGLTMLEIYYEGVLEK